MHAHIDLSAWIAYFFFSHIYTHTKAGVYVSMHVYMYVQICIASWLYR